jgi:hypothetical protein
MRRLLLTIVLLAVGLGLVLGPFHVHADGSHCNVCKDVRVATPEIRIFGTEAAPRLPELVAVAARVSLPEARSHARPPLRAPPSA